MAQHTYHIAPKNLYGTVIYPLNELRKLYPETYQEHIEKYRDREALLSLRIASLDCLWNDVLHFSPVHPSQIRHAFKDTGHGWPSLPTKWIEADPFILGLSEQNAALYFPRQREKGDFTVDALQFKPWFDGALQGLSKLPETTFEYYRRCKANGERPFLFHLIPHVLFCGSVDLSEVEVISV
ncbi:MAG: hypothetical protein AAFQ89_22715 [Cyanobacteria bacterium J06626_18]